MTNYIVVDLQLISKLIRYHHGRKYSKTDERTTV